MKNTIEPAAEFIRPAASVDANAPLKDECGVEYKKPSQVQYYTLYAVWDLDCDDPGIIGLFETKDEAVAHAAYVTHKSCRAMAVVEYLTKENENK